MNTSHTLRVAAPSYVTPGTIVENCLLVQGKVAEVALLFFDTSSSLAYTKEDLPQSLVDLPLSFHCHLPLDLPWHSGAEEVWCILQQLASKIAFLKPTAYILHPPENPSLFCEVLRLWIEAGLNPTLLLLENTAGCDLMEYLPIMDQSGARICFDFGHFLAYDQHHLLEVDRMWPMVSMMHLYCPGSGHNHLSMTQLQPYEMQLMEKILSFIKNDVTVVLEIFEQKGFLDSFHFLQSWLTAKGYRYDNIGSWWK